jgi:hypothetical protein
LRGGERELYVIGPQGAGKSSLIAAGVIPRLKDSPEFADGRFAICVMRPGSDPTGELSKALLTPRLAPQISTGELYTSEGMRNVLDHVLSAQPGSDRVLVIVDQLEEIFTTASREACRQFASVLERLRCDQRAVLMFVLRTEFYNHLLESPLWPGPGDKVSRVDIATLRGDALRDAILAPAADVGVHCEPALVKRLLQDASNEACPLPSLQDTLVELWQQRMRNLLRLHDYPAQVVVRRVTRGRAFLRLIRLDRRRARSPRPALAAPPSNTDHSIETGLRRFADEQHPDDGVMAWVRAGQDWLMLVAPLVALAVVGTAMRVC